MVYNIIIRQHSVQDPWSLGPFANLTFVMTYEVLVPPTRIVRRVGIFYRSNDQIFFSFKTFS